MSVLATDAVGVAETGLTTTGLVTSTTARLVAPTLTSSADQFAITFTDLPVAGGQLTLTVRSLTVVVGTPQSNQTPIAFAPAVGVALPDLPGH